MPARYRNDAERIRLSTAPDANGCWIWQRRLGAKGYGQLAVSENGSVRTMYAHRFAYETLVGPIPDGLQLDHLCRVRACCNPDHLEPVSARTNLRRSPYTRASVNGRKTHCPQGHPYDESNTYIAPDGARTCRPCRRLGDTARRQAVSA